VYVLGCGMVERTEVKNSGGRKQTQSPEFYFAHVELELSLRQACRNTG
jgi:hypothetical protein